MTYDEMFKKAVKAYFSGVQPTNLKTASGKKLKYTKKYFDKISEEKNIDKVSFEED